MSMTPAQTNFLRSLDEEPGVWAECDEAEFRTAMSLVKRGIVEMDRDYTGESAPRRFEARTKSVQPDYNNALREIPYGEHLFVMARPVKGDWKDFNFSTMRQGRHEFRPCMIQGHESGQRIYVIGSQYAYELSQFEIRDVNLKVI